MRLDGPARRGYCSEPPQPVPGVICEPGPLTPMTFGSGGFRRVALHRTPEIDSFLTPDRDDKFIVHRDQGFGKTLLLKAKRILYQREGRSGCFPPATCSTSRSATRSSAGRRSGFSPPPPCPGRSSGSRHRDRGLKHADAVNDLKVNPRLAGLIDDDRLHGVIDHFVRLLDFTPSELQRCATDTDGQPRAEAEEPSNPRWPSSSTASTSTSTSTWKDRGASPSVTGELSPNVWYFAQLGLVEVA